MRPTPYLLLALVALALLAPKGVEAQSLAAYTNITRVDIKAQGSDDFKQKKVATPVYINAYECNGEFKFKLAPIATMVSVMEAWVTTKTGVDCSTSQSRSRINNNVPDCWNAGSASGVTGEYTFPLEGVRIFDRADTDGELKCPTEAINQIYYVTFVPLSSSSDTSGANAPDALLNVIKPRAQFTLYTKPPTPPTEVKGRDGKRALTVTWKRTDNNARTRYRAFFDYGAGGGTCGSGVLDGLVTDGGTVAPVDDAGTDAGVLDGMDAGVDVDAAADPTDDAATDESADASAQDDDGDDEDDVDTSPGNVAAPIPGAPGTEMLKIIDDIAGTSAAWKDIEALPIGTKVQVAVSTIDPTGNVGPLSERVCVERTNAQDFIDLCNETEDCGLESCSAAPGRSGSTFGLAAVALAALCALIRRRRRSA